MNGKTTPELTPAADVQDADLLVSYRSPGPLKKLTASIFGNYVSKTLTAFIAAGVSATARTLQDKARDFVSDADYPTLEAAATAALLVGKPLGITQTNTRSTTWTAPAGLEIVGRGGNITTTNNVANAIQAGGDGVRVRGVRLIGPNGGTLPGSITTASGVSIQGADLCEVTDCIITGFAWFGVLLRNQSGARVTGNLFYNNPYSQAGSADICSYSTVNGNDTIIAHNRCFSNNDLGIYFNATGGDSNVSILGNICVPTTNGVDLPADGANNRRHGIIMGYNGGVQQVSCVGNVVRGTKRTGIYSPSGGALTEGLIISGNTIEDCGFDSVDSPLSGGIYILGGGVGTIISSNTITNFRQSDILASTGAISVSSPLAGSSGTICNNTITNSQTNGIVLKGASINWLVEGNTVSNSAHYDVFEENASVVDGGGHDYINNQFIRSNDAYASMFIFFASSARTSRVINNKFYGAGKVNTTSAGVRLFNGNTTKQLIVTGNLFNNFYDGVAVTQNLTGRVFSQFYIDRNHFDDCFNGIVATGTDAVLPLEGNTFVNCTSSIRSTAAYLGRRDGTNIVLISRAAAPTAGTWIVGDRAVGPGVIGSPKAWTVTTAGVAGAAVWTSEGNL
jgi:hypothetical protein